MDIGQQKEQFSIAYIHAVAAAAGFAIYQPTVDEDSIDLGIAARGVKGSRRSPRLELQLKCTEKGDWNGDFLPYSLKIKNYLDLKGDDLVVPRILVIVIVPASVGEWLRHSDQELVLRKCGYWLSLREAPDSPNTNAVTVQVPRSQTFTVESLTRIMTSIAGGTRP